MSHTDRGVQQIGQDDHADDHSVMRIPASVLRRSINSGAADVQYKQQQLLDGHLAGPRRHALS